MFIEYQKTFFAQGNSHFCRRFILKILLDLAQELLVSRERFFTILLDAGREL